MKIKKTLSLGTLITILALSGCSGNKNQSANTTENQNAATVNVPPATPRTDTIIITGMAFSPDTLTIAKGDTVYWINRDIVAHNITQFPEAKWKSDLLNPSDHFSKVLDDSASYYCSIHPTMHGKVLVK